jgi:hypothetical protein
VFPYLTSPIYQGIENTRQNATLEHFPYFEGSPIAKLLKSWESQIEEVPYIYRNDFLYSYIGQREEGQGEWFDRRALAGKLTSLSKSGGASCV